MDNLEVKKILIEESLRKSQMSQILMLFQMIKWYFSDRYNNIKTTNYCWE